jgi:hypothetical protein
MLDKLVRIYKGDKRRVDGVLPLCQSSPGRIAGRGN